MSVSLHGRRLKFGPRLRMTQNAKSYFLGVCSKTSKDRSLRQDCTPFRCVLLNSTANACAGRLLCGRTHGPREPSFDHVERVFNERTKTEDSGHFALEAVPRPLLDQMWAERPKPGSLRSYMAMALVP
jgi:hypothetical protein